MLVKPDRHLGVEGTNDSRRKPRLLLGERARTGVLGAARLPDRFPARWEVPIQIDSEGVEPGAQREAIRVQVKSSTRTGYEPSGARGPASRQSSAIDSAR
jgi:hypothetical protein